MTALASQVYHLPVMLREASENLRIRPGSTHIDCTVGEGGHALAITQASQPGGRLLGLDRDTHALETARQRLSAQPNAVSLVHASFAELAPVAQEQYFTNVDGILYDLGISSLQLESQGRGFSFRSDEPLDMRFDPSQGATAADIVNSESPEMLEEVIFSFGDEPRARRISRAITRHRPINTTSKLAHVIEKGAGYRRGRTHPATRTFQALRIAVNGELKALEQTLPQAVSLLRPGGRLVCIAYHSLEDRIIKEFLRSESSDCLCPSSAIQCQCSHTATLHRVTKKILVPDPAEVRLNPRSRSARMRVAERLGSAPQKRA